MFKKKIIENFIINQDFSDFFEEFDAKNYNTIQRLYVLPMIAKNLGYESIEQFINDDQAEAMKIMALFKDVIVDMFGNDSSGRPNSSIEDDPQWNIDSPEFKQLAQEIVKKIMDKLAVSVEAE